MAAYCNGGVLVDVDDLSLTEKKRQHYAHDETKPHKTCLFLDLYSIEVPGELGIELLG